MHGKNKNSREHIYINMCTFSFGFGLEKIGITELDFFLVWRCCVSFLIFIHQMIRNPLLHVITLLDKIKGYGQESFTCIPSRKFMVTCIPLKSSETPIYHRVNFLLPTRHFVHHPLGINSLIGLTGRTHVDNCPSCPQTG